MTKMNNSKQIVDINPFDAWVSVIVISNLEFIWNLVLGFCFFATISTNRKCSSLAPLLVLLVSISSIYPAIAADPEAYLQVTGPCGLEFPRDHGAHPGYRTEWWYYTGNLRSSGGDRYGFQLTFFRSRISPPGTEKAWPDPPSAWRTQQVYAAHAALTDIGGKRHLQAERLSRGALEMAGVRQGPTETRVFLKDWSARIGPESQELTAVAEDFSFELTLSPAKAPVLHGRDGYSRKGSSPENASCYYSFTRLEAGGSLTIAGREVAVSGLAWMDHEFSTAPLEAGIKGWDWFSLQLSDQTEIMAFLLRTADGGISPASSGTWVASDGNSHHLSKDEFSVNVLDTWKSPHSKAVYPSRWHLRVPEYKLDVVISPNLADQEMRTSAGTDITYWEGSVSIRGTHQGKPVDGQGYVELTGYARDFDAPM